MELSFIQKEVFETLRKDIALLIQYNACLWIIDENIDSEYFFTGTDRLEAGESDDEEEEEDDEYQFHFNNFEGSFDGSIYCWINEYLKSRNFYEKLFTGKLLELANKSEVPFRPTNYISHEDELYEEAEKAQNYIEWLENESIFIVGVVSEECGYACQAIDYFLEYEMESYIKRFKLVESEEKKILNEILENG